MSKYKTIEITEQTIIDLLTELDMYCFKSDSCRIQDNYGLPLEIGDHKQFLIEIVKKWVKDNNKYTR